MLRQKSNARGPWLMLPILPSAFCESANASKLKILKRFTFLEHRLPHEGLLLSPQKLLRPPKATYK